MVFYAFMGGLDGGALQGQGPGEVGHGSVSRWEYGLLGLSDLIIWEHATLISMGHPNAKATPTRILRVFKGGCQNRDFRFSMVKKTGVSRVFRFSNT